MKTVKSVESRRAFVLDRGALERLVHALGGDEAVSQIVVDFSDGSTGGFDHVADALEIGNGEGKRIEALAVECVRRPVAWQPTDSPLRYVWVRLRYGRGNTVRCHISGDERDVLPISERLDAWVDSVTPWYGRLAALDGVAFLFLSLIVVAAFAVIALALQATVPAAPRLAPDLEGAQRLGAVRILALLSVALPLPLAAVLALLRGRLFPVGAFAIGSGERRERRAEALRRTVGWATAACGVGALAAGVASGLLG